MSAHKRTTVAINEEQYRQMHEAAMQKRFLEKDIPEITRALRQETQKAVQHSMDMVEQRQEKYREVLESMQTEVRNVELNTSQVLQTRDHAFWQALEESAGNLWTDMTNLLLEEREMTYQHIRQDHLGRQRQMDQLQRDVQHNRRETDRREQIALSWVEAAREMMSHIDLNYRHEQFCPGEFYRVESMLSQAEQNLEMAIPESALTLAQQAYTSFSRLRIELEDRQTEHEAILLAARERNRQLIQLIERNQFCHAVDLDGKELEQMIEVDQWVNGALAEQLTYLGNLLNQLEAHGTLVETSMLRELLEQTYPEIQGELEESIHAARIIVLNSQLRVNIADLVLQALQTQGYEFEQSGYAEQDMRHSYYANTRGEDGSQVIIQVDPVEGSETRNELHIHTVNDNRLTHHELRQRAREINLSLANYGLLVGTTKTQADEGNRVLQRLDRSRKSQQIYRHYP